MEDRQKIYNLFNEIAKKQPKIKGAVEKMIQDEQQALEYS